MRSEASSPEEYLSALPDERRAALEAVRRVILENLPAGYEEAVNWGMITYQVPLTVYPNTYNKQPLMYAALASQKNHMKGNLRITEMRIEKKNEGNKAQRDLFLISQRRKPSI